MAVSFIPLLFLGFVLSWGVPFPDHDYTVRCDRQVQSGREYQFCFPNSYAEDHYRIVLPYPPKSFYPKEIRAHSVQISNAQITRVGPYNSLVTNEPDTYIGKKVPIFLVGENGLGPLLKNPMSSSGHLICEDLYIDDPASGIYRSTCRGDEWRAFIFYTTDAEGEEYIRVLQSAIERVASQNFIRWIVYSSLVYPFFIYLFFAASIAWVLAKRASAYVRNG